MLPRASTVPKKVKNTNVAKAETNEGHRVFAGQIRARERNASPVEQQDLAKEKSAREGDKQARKHTWSRQQQLQR